MAVFRYRLATMLQLRENERQRCHQELAAAQHEEERIVRELTKLKNELTNLQRRVQEASRPGRIDVDRLRNSQRYEQQLHADLQAWEEKHRAAADLVERCRQVLLEAVREVRTLEKHRELVHAQHTSHERSREIKRLDEQATQAARRSAQTKALKPEC